MAACENCGDILAPDSDPLCAKCWYELGAAAYRPAEPNRIEAALERLAQMKNGLAERKPPGTAA